MEIIKKDNLVHRDVKPQIQLFKKPSKVNTSWRYTCICKSANIFKQRKAREKHAYKIVNNVMYKDNAAHNENSTINNIRESPQAESSRSSIAEDENAREKEIERKRTFEFDEESDNNVAPVDFRMNSLYHCLYKLVSNAILL